MAIEYFMLEWVGFPPKYRALRVIDAPAPVYTCRHRIACQPDPRNVGVLIVKLDEDED